MPTPLNNSVLKAFEILSLLDRTRPEISSAMVAEALGLNNATAHRFLLTLESTGALRSTKRGYFALGPKIDELGLTSQETGAIGLLIQPELNALSAALGESVMVCRLSRIGPRCVAVANSSQAISVNITVGTVLPFYTSAQGKLWLSEMDQNARQSLTMNAAKAGIVPTPKAQAHLEEQLGQIARVGHATNLGETEADIAAYAVPIRDHTDRMTLSLSVFGLLRRFDDAFLEMAGPKIAAASKRISRLLG